MRHQERDRLKDKGTITVILGIDPGTVNFGYGLIKQLNSDYEYLHSGVIRVSQKKPLQERLKAIYDGLNQVLRDYRPDVAVIERIFFAGGIKASLGLGYARAVALLAVAQHDIPVYEYSTLEVKRAVTGYGRAEKTQVSDMVRKLLGLSRRPPYDSADALALCICHAHIISTRLIGDPRKSKDFLG